MTEPTTNDIQTDHEYDGIREYDNPLPVWWLGTFIGAVVFAFVYWYGFHSLPSETTHEIHAKEWQAYQIELAANAVDEETLVELAKTPAAIASGRETFVKLCVTCHADQGQGEVGPNLTDAYWLNGGEPKEVWTTVAFGQTVKGMPAWRSMLGAKKVDEVTAYVISIRDTNQAGKAPQGVNAAGDGP